MAHGASDRPRLRGDLVFVPIEGEGGFLIGEGVQGHLPGPLFSELIPLLDGRRALEQVFAALVERHSIHEVYAALARLRELGWLVDGPAPASMGPAAVAFWDGLGIGAGEAAVRLARARVFVGGQGERAIEPWVAALRAAGAAVVPALAEATLGVVVVDDHLDPALESIDAAARDLERPWVLVRPAGHEAWLGPLFVPGRTGCWSCLAHRLRGHRRLEAHLRAKTGEPGPFGPARAALPSTLDAVRGLLVTEVVRWVVTGESSLVGAVLSVELAGLERRTHRLVRRPQCPACGRPPPVDAVVPVRLTDEPAAAVPNDAGVRACSAESTVRRLEHHISPITGIVGHLQPRRVESAELTPLFVTDHGFVEMDQELYFLREGFRKRSGGKGTTRAQAMASALGESIERYCGVAQGDEPRRTATLEELGDAAIHPNDVMGYSARQYEQRERHNAAGSRVRWVPEPFEPARPVEWTPLWSLVADAPRWLPTACCYYGHRQPGPRFALADSNGCAAGNTLAEAVLQGLLELVERDAVALWWYNRVARPGLELAACDEPYVAAIAEHYRDALRREAWVLELTSDLGIPTVAAVSRRVDGPPEDVVLGFGAHLDSRVALLRAVTEMNQSLPSVPGPRPGPGPRYPGHNHDAIRWWSTATVEAEPWLRPAPRAAPSSLDLGGEPHSEPSTLAAVERCVRLLADRGLETLVLDQTRPDAGLHVARVVVPGLRHFWARFGPGRLYHVPVALGWLDEPRPEAHLNPHVVYF